ncbi:GNAT family N-acetyltransferase [Microlunatus phosphovorus]|uniref:GNAT family N-acetyltransferase n=1 Tax=Microlunatus phosphovorus TaxID=29405 RepID=UPI00067408BE|nr:GNAT family protein [Microlunatus phosphovorus]
MTEPGITFVRLPEVSTDAVVELLNEPRNARHMPLTGEPFTTKSAAAWVAAKDAQWDSHGYGPWAILIDGSFAGWGGFQAEENGADFALVLAPEFWGYGETVARRALAVGFDELGLTDVLIALPYSRNPAQVVARFGFEPDGDVVYGEVHFRQYRLSANRWNRDESV